MVANHRPLVLLTGASGYIGGRLLKELEKAGWTVRCLARRPDFLRPKVDAPTEVVKADCLDRSSLVPAMAGVQTAYYLVHSMGSSGKFEQEDREAAQNFADVARDSGVRRIVYLGGLGSQDQALSAHLRSRHEVADILRSSEIPTIEFRASIVIGSGSLSFEMIRALVCRQSPADRGRRCGCVPHGRAGVAGGTVQGLRNRGHRPSQLRPDHAGV